MIPTSLDNRPIALSVTVALVAAIVAAAVVGQPDRLPGVALGSAVVLFVERVLAVFAALLFILLVFERAWAREQLPEEISGRGVKYASAETAEELRRRVEELSGQLLEALEQLDDRVSALEDDE